MWLFKKTSTEQYIKEHDKTYVELLRLARVSDNTNFTDEKLNQAVETLNKLPKYAKVHQRLLPLLNAKARKLELFDRLNPNVQNILTATTQWGVVTELAKQKQLEQIINRLTSKNIPVILLKGIAFSGTLYSEDAPRLSNDIDLLIKKEHWKEAVDIINSIMNYSEKPTEGLFSDLYELSFKPKTKTGAALDLHVSLTHPYLFNINEDELWQYSKEHQKYNNELVRVLSPEHAIIHQAIHAYKDMNFSKYNLVDSFEILNQSQICMPTLVETAKRWGAANVTYYLLDFCQQVLGLKISEQILKQLKPNQLSVSCALNLLRTPITELEQAQKTFNYRIKQVLSQFVYTGSIVRPLSLQFLYIKLKLKNRIKRYGSA